MGGVIESSCLSELQVHVIHHYSIISFYYSCIDKIYIAENKVFMIAATAFT